MHGSGSWWKVLVCPTPRQSSSTDRVRGRYACPWLPAAGELALAIATPTAPLLVLIRKGTFSLACDRECSVAWMEASIDLTSASPLAQLGSSYWILMTATCYWLPGVALLPGIRWHLHIWWLIDRFPFLGPVCSLPGLYKHILIYLWIIII